MTIFCSVGAVKTFDNRVTGFARANFFGGRFTAVPVGGHGRV